jgi:hypothetical protein
MSKYGFSYSWKRVLGINSAKHKFALETGIPTTNTGLERKLGRTVLALLLGLLWSKKI